MKQSTKDEAKGKFHEVKGKVKEKIGADRLILSPSCSLLHSPLSSKDETTSPSEVKRWLSFAEEKLFEVTALARMTQAGNGASLPEFITNQEEIRSHRNHPGTHVNSPNPSGDYHRPQASPRGAWPTHSPSGTA